VYADCSDKLLLLLLLLLRNAGRFVVQPQAKITPLLLLLLLLRLHRAVTTSLARKKPSA
jgi:hypothetical protein